MGYDTCFEVLAAGPRAERLRDLVVVASKVFESALDVIEVSEVRHAERPHVRTTDWRSRS